MNLPAEFCEKISHLLGEEYAEYIKCFENPQYYGLRVNRLKLTCEEAEKRLPFALRQIPWIPNGFYYDEKETPAKHPYYHAGLYYLQEPSAMTPASRLLVEPGDKVLDLCAAPGGKATELGACLNGSGVLVANDISSSRAKALLKNLELFGIENMILVNEESERLVEYFPEYFDKILIDAPCSGEGMFRKDRKMIKSWEEHGPEFFQEIQKKLILDAAKMLRPGGTLLYSTCTFDSRENEQVIEYLLEERNDFYIAKMQGYEGFSEGYVNETKTKHMDFRNAVRIWPHKMKGEGHFLALLKKEGAEEPVKEKKYIVSYQEQKLPEELKEFLGFLNESLDEKRIMIQKERVFYMPEDLPNLKGIRFIRSGLYIGDIKKKRFEPSQTLAMCLNKNQYSKCLNFPLSDVRVIKYLKGETLHVEDLAGTKEKGWYLVLVDGFALGFGKLANGTLKNKYLPGWRWTSI